MLIITFLFYPQSSILAAIIFIQAIINLVFTFLSRKTKKKYALGSKLHVFSLKLYFACGVENTDLEEYDLEGALCGNICCS